MRQAAIKSSVRYSTVQTVKGFLLKESPVNGNGKRSERLENVIIHGDARSELKLFPAEHVDLIFTSPPYADSRKKTYGGIHPDRYVEWFVPFTAEFLRVLKPTGSFVLNIKEKVVDGERHT